MRLIDADILDKALASLRFTADGKLAHWGDRKDWCLHGSEIEMLIAHAPTIESEPVRHGKWVREDGGFVHCSVCNGSPLLDGEREYVETPFCPNCGAKLDGCK